MILMRFNVFEFGADTIIRQIMGMANGNGHAIGMHVCNDIRNLNAPQQIDGISSLLQEIYMMTMVFGTTVAILMHGIISKRTLMISAAYNGR